MADLTGFLARHCMTNTRFRVAFLSAVALTSIFAAPSHAEQPRATSCAEKMEKFVESIDELLAKKVLEDEPFWAVIRENLPVKGCSVEEVISISRKSILVRSGCRAGSLVKLTVEGMRFSSRASVVGVLTVAVIGRRKPRSVAALSFSASSISLLSARWLSSVAARELRPPNKLISAFSLAPWSFVAAL